jgi:hypothetical protein
LAADWANRATEPVTQAAAANAIVSPMFTARKKSTLGCAALLSGTRDIVPDKGTSRFGLVPWHYPRWSLAPTVALVLMEP